MTIDNETQIGGSSEQEMRFWAKVHAGPGGCWIWQGSRDPQGYGRTRINRRLSKAHRVAWTLTNGPIPEGAYVLHRCDNPPCVRPDHLFLGSAADNTADMIAKGRHCRAGNPYVRGEDRPSAKLTEDNVREIRRRYADGERSYNALAKAYGVHDTTIRNVVIRRKWKHVV